MTFTLTQPYPRLWSLEAGLAMVVTDLHGDWDAYRRYRDRFVDLQAGGQADCLIFTGDLIHRENPEEPDGSIEIVLDIMALQARYGQAIIYLCGNHEIPHLYSISLVKGERSYTPAFEAALDESERRDEVIALFDSLPFYIRTTAGVTLAHAGAASPFVRSGNAQKLFNWSHRDLLTWAEGVIGAQEITSLQNGYAKLQGAPNYDVLARHYLNISGPDDPRYNHLLRGFFASSQPDFDQILWPALFTRCEKEYGLADYRIFMDAMLKEIAVGFSAQRMIVAGHMAMQGGHQIIGKTHLRLASAEHATPHEAGQYLLFDAAQPIPGFENLLGGLGSVF